MKVNWCKRKKMIEKSQNELYMHKKFIFLLLLISNYVVAMEQIVATHPLVTAAEQGNTQHISQELERLKHMFASSIMTLFSCNNTQAAEAFQKKEEIFFGKITYTALAAAIKNKKADAAIDLLYKVPVCLHNNPEYLLHEAAKGNWKCNLFATQEKILELMIKNGALAHQKHPMSGKTPAEIAQETSAHYQVCHFLKEAAQKQKDYEKNFKPYHREVRIPPYYSIVSYESAQTIDDERRIEHYKQHSRVEYKPN